MSHNPTFGREKGQCVGVRGWPGELLWGADIEELPATRRRSSDAAGLCWILKKQLPQLLPQAGRPGRAPRGPPRSSTVTEATPPAAPEWVHLLGDFCPPSFWTFSCFPFIEAFKTLQCNPSNTRLVVIEKMGVIPGSRRARLPSGAWPISSHPPESPVRQALFSSSFYRLGSESQRG